MLELKFMLSDDRKSYKVAGVGPFGKNAKRVVIPDTYKGKPVTSIDERAFAFYKCKSLTSVIIPDSVTSIGKGAFAYCKSLTSVIIPNSVASIGDHAFSGCESLTSVSIPDRVTFIGEGAFSRCKSLTSVSISNGVTSIGDCAFVECESLANVNIPNSVTYIGKEAFRSCIKLACINIPDSVIYIGESAFSECDELTICCDQAGKGCDWKSNWDGGRRTFWQPGLAFELSDDGESYTVVEMLDCDRIKSKELVIPHKYDGKPVTSIGEKAFSQSKRLTSVSIPDSVISIGEGAFYGCVSLARVNIPNSVESIGKEAFRSCIKLACINIPDSVTYIGESAFSECDELTIYCDVYEDYRWKSNKSKWDGGRPTFWDQGLALELSDDGESYTVVEGWVDDDKIRKKEFVIPRKYDGKPVTSIDERAFAYCKSLTSVIIPDSVISIGEEAFSGCENLTSVSIPNSVTFIGGWAFTECKSLTSITIPESVTFIGESAFNLCDKLASIFVDINRSENYGAEKSVDRAIYASIDGNLYSDGGATLHSYAIGKKDSVFYIPDGVTSIGERAFEGCKGLTSVIIPDSVTSIGEDAFSGCENLTSVSIPNSITSIGGWAFSECKSLTSITIPESVTFIGERAFSLCDNLASIFVDINRSENYGVEKSVNRAIYASIDGNLYSDGGATLHSYACGKKDSVFYIPDGVTSIGERAFGGCKGLTSVIIPDSVTSIGVWAFGDCESLTSVTIPRSVTEIGSYAFHDCKSLTSVTIPDSVTSIGFYAFFGSDKLTIRCEALSKPNGYNEDWAGNIASIEWGCKQKSKRKK